MPNLFQKLLSMSGPVAKRGSTSAVRAAKEALEEAPEVLGRGSSKLSKEAAEEIPDALWREITPAPKPVSTFDAIKKLAKENPKAAAALTTIIGGTAANQFMGGDDEPPVQVPFARGEEPKESVLPDNYMQLAQDEANSMGQGDSAKPQAPKLAGPDNGSSRTPTDMPVTPEVDEFQDASDRADRNAMYAMLGKAASTVGSGIATLGSGQHISAETGGFDDLLKRADIPVSRLKEKQSHQKAKDELNDEKAMRDPDSEISKMVTGIAQKVGLLKPGQTATAMSLKNSGVNLGTLLSTIEAGNARRDAASLARETRSADQDAKIQAKKDEEDAKRKDKRKLVTEEVEDRSRNLNDSIQMLQDKIDKYGTFELTGPQEEDMKRLTDTIATDMAKLADPNSVARPAEVELWKRNLAKVGGMQGLSMTNQTAKDILGSFKDEVEKRRQHAYKVRGVDVDNDPTPSPDNNSGKSGMVKVIAPNGKTKMIPADQVDAAIKAGGKLAQ